MRTVSDLTYKVIAYSEVPNKNMDECVDWAIEMIELGYDTPHLLMLAGFTKPTNYFEVSDYLKNALKELGIKELSGEAALISYGYYYIRKIATGEYAKKHLASIKEYWIEMGHDSLFYDFYLLWWAWDDFDDGQEYQYYWDGATKENIEALVTDKAREWLQIHGGDVLVNIWQPV